MPQNTSINPNEPFYPDQQKKIRPHPGDDEPYQPTEPDDPEGPDEAPDEIEVQPLSFDDDTVEMQLDDFDEEEFDSEQGGNWGSSAQLEGDAGLGDTGLNYTGLGDTGLSDGVGGIAGDTDPGYSGMTGGLGSDSALINDLDEKDSELEDEELDDGLDGELDDGLGGESILEKDLSAKRDDELSSRQKRP